MLFFYVRHGDPIYDPDSLTPLGERQAEAVAKRLAMHGVHKIYASTSNRAMMTAEPTCEILKMDKTLVDFANEHYAWQQLTVNQKDGGCKWAFDDKETKKLFTDPEVLGLGHNWYDHPAFANTKFKEGIERIQNASDEFFKALGYEHIKGTGVYKVVEPNAARVAMFAHQGFGLAFLSCILEVTNGVFLASGNISLPLIAGIIGFGGLCGHCQVMPYLVKLRLRYKYFFVARVVSGALSVIYCKFLTDIFPVSYEVISIGTLPSQRASAVSSAVSIGMLFTAGLFLLGDSAVINIKRKQTIPVGGESQRQDTKGDGKSLPVERSKTLSPEMHGITVKKNGTVPVNGLQVLKLRRADKGQRLLRAGAGKLIVFTGKCKSHVFKLLRLENIGIRFRRHHLRWGVGRLLPVRSLNCAGGCGNEV